MDDPHEEYRNTTPARELLSAPASRASVVGAFVVSALAILFLLTTWDLGSQWWKVLGMAAFAVAVANNFIVSMRLSAAKHRARETRHD